MHVKPRPPVANRLSTLAILIAWSMHAYAQTPPDQDLCAKGTADQAIAACGRLLAPGQSAMKRDAAYYYRARAWVEKRDFDRAIADLTEAIRLNPNFADAYYNRGRVWQDKREPDRAIADYNEAIRINPKDAVAYNNRGIAWDMKNDAARAMADFNEALKLDPKHASAYTNRGNLWQRSRNVERAIADYDEAIRLGPKDASTYNNRGYALHEKREYERALADANAALQLNAAHPGALNLAARLMAGAPDARLRNGKRAVELAQKACELTGWKNGHFITTLAAAYAETGNFAEAVKHQEQALAIPAYEKTRGQDGRGRLALYKATKPYREPAK